MNEMKAGPKTTEFWIMLIATIASALAASGIFSEDSIAMKVLGVIGAVISSVWYTASRTSLKKEIAKSNQENDPGGPNGTTFWILALAFCLGVTCPAQEITVETDKGSFVENYGAGGTLANPHPFGGGFRSIDLPDRQGMLIVASGTDLKFRRVTTDRYVVYTVGSRPKVGEFGVDYIPDDPLTFRRGSSHELLAFEALPILFPNDAHLPPSQAKVAQIQLELAQTTNLAEISKWPRMIRLLQTFDDRYVPQRVPFDQTDMGWLIRNWAYTAGGRQMVGYYNGICPRGSGGFDNWNYNGLLWLAAHYVAAPRDDLYRFGLQQAIAHACFGRTWFGPDAGLSRYEKGDKFIGENYQPNAWEKQWSAGLIVWARMTGNPILRMQVDLMREQLRRSDPDTIWKGYWGARIGARYLDELLAHWLNHREEWIVDKARRHIANCKKWQLADGTWPNLGNNGAAPRSPWMQAELVSSIFRWLEHRPDLAASFPVADLVDAGAAVWSTGSTRIHGKPCINYRFEGPEKPPKNIHITAFAVPMLRHMAGVDPDRFGAISQEVTSFVFGWVGSSFADLAAGSPLPITSLAERLPVQGLGWPKAKKECFEGAR